MFNWKVEDQLHFIESALFAIPDKLDFRIVYSHSHGWDGWLVPEDYLDEYDEAVYSAGFYDSLGGVLGSIMIYIDREYSLHDLGLVDMWNSDLEVLPTFD